MHADGGLIVVSGLMRVAVVLALFALVAFDAISVTSTAMRAADAADRAAVAGAASFHTTHDVQAAYQAAVDAVGDPLDLVPPDRFVVDPDGTVHVTVIREATTMLLHHIGPLRHLAEVAQTGTGRPAT